MEQVRRRSRGEKEVPVSLISSWEGCCTEILASSLPLGVLDVHAERGQLWCEQRQAERVRERAMKMEGTWEKIGKKREKDTEDSKKKKNRKKVRATGRRGGCETSAAAHGLSQRCSSFQSWCAADWREACLPQRQRLENRIKESPGQPAWHTLY